MSHQATLLPLGEPFVELPTVDSTNNYAMGQVRNGLARHGAAFFAHNQTAGKGQRGKSWTANPQENIIISVVLEPGSLKHPDSFYLSAAVAMACYDFFKKYGGEETRIKWPNDIYWRDRKAGGILIENIVQKGLWSYAIVGIGININQISFAPVLGHAVSLRQITGNLYDPVSLARELCKTLQTQYELLQRERDTIAGNYNKSLYKLNESIRLRKENIVFSTTLKGVSPKGKLMTIDNMKREFDFGEVEWVL